MTRPKSENPKECIVKLRMNKEEKAELEKFAKEYEYTVSDTIRYALKHFYEMEPIRKQIADVSPLGYCHRLQQKKSDVNKNGYTLEGAILENKDIRNGAKVYELLHASGCDNWKDAVNMYRNGYLPNPRLNGIGEKTWPILIDMVAEEELYRFPYGRRALELAIDEACPGRFVSERNVKAKIQPSLRRINIYTLEELWGAPEAYIRDSRNIGPLMWSSILKIRDKEVGSHIEHYDAFINHYNSYNRFSAECQDKLGRWKRMANEQLRE